MGSDGIVLLHSWCGLFGCLVRVIIFFLEVPPAGFTRDSAFSVILANLPQSKALRPSGKLQFKSKLTASISLCFWYQPAYQLRFSVLVLCFCTTDTSLKKAGKVESWFQINQTTSTNPSNSDHQNHVLLHFSDPFRLPPPLEEFHPWHLGGCHQLPCHGRKC